MYCIAMGKKKNHRRSRNNDNMRVSYQSDTSSLGTISSWYMISDPSSSADCDDGPSRQSVGSSDRFPLFCDEKETKRIVEENQCHEYGNRVAEPAQDTEVSGASRGAAAKGKRAAASKSNVSSRTTLKQKLRLQADQPSPDVEYLKPREVPSMKATHQAKSNKAYDLRYEYTRKGVTIPSTMLDHMDNHNKPLFLRFWKGKRCFEYANDRAQPLIRQELKRRKSSGESFKSTKAPIEGYRARFDKRRESPGSRGTSRSPSSESGITRGSSGHSPKSRASGYTTGAGGSPSAARGSALSGYTTGGVTSPSRGMGTDSGCTPFDVSSPSTKSRTTRTSESASAAGGVASKATQGHRTASPRKAQKGKKPGSHGKDKLGY